MIATDVCSRGLDVRNIALVINFDVPTQVEQYIHRFGRTGRAGDKGEAVTLLSQYDRDGQRMLEQVGLNQLNTDRVCSL